MSITVGDVNRPPIISEIGSFTATEAQNITFDVNVQDPDNDAFQVRTIDLPAGASFDGRTFTWTPGYLQAGVYPVTFTAEDDGSPSESSSLATIITVGQTQSPLDLAEFIVKHIVRKELPRNTENAYIANVKKVAVFVEAGQLVAARNQVAAVKRKIEQDALFSRIDVDFANELLALLEELRILIT
jgi:hypothetical protein